MQSIAKAIFSRRPKRPCNSTYSKGIRVSTSRVVSSGHKDDINKHLK